MNTQRKENRKYGKKCNEIESKKVPKLRKSKRGFYRLIALKDSKDINKHRNASDVMHRMLLLLFPVNRSEKHNNRHRFVV